MLTDKSTVNVSRMESIQKGLDILLSCLIKNDLNIIGLFVTSCVYCEVFKFVNKQQSLEFVYINQVTKETWNFKNRLLNYNY